MSNSSAIILIYQWRQRSSTRLSKSSSSSHSHSHSPFSFNLLSTMLMYILILMFCIKIEAHKTESFNNDYDYTLPTLSHRHLTNIPGLDHKMTEYRTNVENHFPTSTRGLFLSLGDSTSLQPSQLEAITEISHLFNWKSHLGVVHNYNHLQQPSVLQSKGQEIPVPAYNSEVNVTPLTKIDSVIDEIRKRKKKGFSVISRLLVGSPLTSPLTNRKLGLGGGVQQRSFVNENDSSVTSIQMRRSASKTRPFRMRLRWG